MGLFDALFGKPQPIEKKRDRIASIERTRRGLKVRMDAGEEIEVPGAVMERWGIYHGPAPTPGMFVQYVAGGRVVLDFTPADPASDDSGSTAQSGEARGPAPIPADWKPCPSCGTRNGRIAVRCGRCGATLKANQEGLSQPIPHKPEYQIGIKHQ